MAERRSSILERLTQNWILKLLSLSFAIILWFFVMGDRKLEVGYAVPLELQNIPPGLMVANEVPGLIDVRISGPRTVLMNLRPSDISIAVDLIDLEPGVTSFKRLEERLNLPSSLRVTRLSPSFVDVRLERVREKSLPVRPVLTGMPAAGFRVGSIRVMPEQMVVQGAESEIKDLTELLTEAVDVTDAQESFTLTVPVNHQGRYTSLKEHRSAEVRVEIEPISPPRDLSATTGGN